MTDYPEQPGRIAISQSTFDEIERVGNEWPDGTHTCEELQRLEPGRRPCTCGRCPDPDSLRAKAARLLADYRQNLEHRICGSLNDRDLWIYEAAELLERITESGD